jgi:hypothetical protein
MAQWDPLATTYTYPLSMVGVRQSTTLGKSRRSLLINSRSRMAACTATTKAKFQSPSQESHTVSTLRDPSE